MWGAVDLQVTFGRTVALDDVDVTISEGEITTVVGGDGAGKTTLSKVMVGLIRPKGGSVRRPARVGYQSSSSGVWGDLTVAENLEFVADAHRLTGDGRSRRIDALLDLTRLGVASDRLAHNLSGGMRQKLGVAMALLPEPNLLILDEPTTGLDPVSRSDLWRLVSRFVTEGTAVMATTAYLDEAERGDQVLALDTGTTLAAGTVNEVRQALPGAVGTVAADADTRYKWRRGATWRAWFPDGQLPEGSSAIDADLADLVTVAAFRRREHL